MHTALLRLEEVFKKSGVPTHTFVRPMEFQRLLVAVRTPGRGVVIEGPSGIGKTSAVVKALAELGTADSARRLSYDPAKPMEEQVGTIAEQLQAKLQGVRWKDKRV